MCGIIAIVIGGARPGGDAHAPNREASGLEMRAARGVAAARRVMAHRGPDGEGTHSMLSGHVVLGHRRLAVMDPTPSGAQPMRSAEGAIVYNGELYNDADVRRQLLAGAMRGDAFASRCDTETMLRAIDAWGAGALDVLRGMFGLVHVNSSTGRVLIARDPMGVKPLYWWRGAIRVDGAERNVGVVASEISAVIAAAREFGHTPAPDWSVVSAYMTTIRTTLGEKTMFEGVRIVEAGAWIELDATSDELRETRGWHGWFKPGKRGATPIEHASHLRSGGAGDCVAVMDASVRAHMRSDVALCSLLSGGVDSTLIAALAARTLREEAGSGPATPLRTFCAGARSSGSGEDDFAWARKVAGAIGSIHSEVVVTRDAFIERWRETVESSGVVMSTPNQVAIQEVARAIRASGHVVALSGEGADELLGGYDLALRGPIEGELGGAEWTRNARMRGVFLTGTSAWIPVGAKGHVLREEVHDAIEGDSVLIDSYAREWEMWCQPWLDGDGYARDCATRAHLRFLARINMHGLLGRLDESTMRWSIEGRTPFADVSVARWASALGAAETFDAREEGVGATKRILREAMMLAAPEGAQNVFEGVRDRAKASFPLPFQEWMVDAREVLRGEASRAIFTPEAIEMVHCDPSRAWALAWPMMNVAMWVERWWGAGAVTEPRSLGAVRTAV